jgi:predicted ATPase
MRVTSFRLAGIRCFEDTSEIKLSPTCNIFVGQNNAGKSTLLKGLLAFQGFPFSSEDHRPGCQRIFHEMMLEDIGPQDHLRSDQHEASRKGFAHIIRPYTGEGHASPTPTKMPRIIVGNDNGIFDNVRPRHSIVPLLARRKATSFEHNINSTVQQRVTGTFSNLYSRIDLVNWGHPDHDDFKQAVSEISGLQIATRASPNGKTAGFYLDRNHFVSLDQMGDGVSEMVGLIVELCLERKKIFVLEEPETNLHPKGLKALMRMVRLSAAHNQFLIATHSNIVVRELASDDSTKVFRVYCDEEVSPPLSNIEAVPRTPSAHRELLRELGYEFADLELHEGWLFLEESSAETIIREVLIPAFAPKLQNRLRTFSAGGTGNVEPTVTEFQRLVTYIHLQPVYEGRVWIRTDSDPTGREAASAIRAKFNYLTEDNCAAFTQPNFEMYYPERFRARVNAVIAQPRGPAKRSEKEKILLEVMAWTNANKAEALREWEVSASEPIDLLRMIEATVCSLSK